MRGIFILFVAIALFLAVVVEGQSYKQVCQPNTVTKVLCNTCRCNFDGTGLACTRKSCPPNTFESPEPYPLNSRMPRAWCKPGSIFETDCNYCRCSKDGKKLACTPSRCI